MLNKRMRVHVWYDVEMPIPFEKDLDILVPVPKDNVLHVENVVDAAGDKLAETIANECTSKNDWKRTRLKMFSVALYVDGEDGKPEKRKILWNAYPLGGRAWKWLPLPYPSWWWKTDSDIRQEEEIQRRIRRSEAAEQAAEDARWFD